MSTLTRREKDPEPTADASPPRAGIAAVPVPAPRGEERAIATIAVYVLIKGVLFLLLAVAALRLFTHDAEEVARYWLKLMGIRHESRWLSEAIGKAGPFMDSWRKLISPLLTFYGLVFIAQGIGLWLRRNWGEWLTVLITGSLVPLEIYELIVHPNVLKVCALLINGAIVWFFVLRLIHSRQRLRAARIAAEALRAANVPAGRGLV